QIDVPRSPVIIVLAPSSRRVSALRVEWCPFDARNEPMGSCSPSHPTREHLYQQAPGRAVIGRLLAEPVERARRDLREAPACARTRRQRAFLHDVRAHRLADLLTEEVRGGVDPEDAPAVEGRVVHPE